MASASILTSISKFTSRVLGRPLTANENSDLIDFVAENDRFVDKNNRMRYVAKLADAYVEFIRNQEADKAKIVEIESQVEKAKVEGLQSGALVPSDLSSDLSTEKDNIIDADIQSIFGINDFNTFIHVMNPAARRRIAYMCLDSRYARFNSNCTKLTWDFENSLVDSPNSTNIVGKIRDITSIRMYSFVICDFDTTYGRATVFIEELAAQSFMLQSGRRFHFMTMLNNTQYPADVGTRNTKPSTAGIANIADFVLSDKFELLAGYRFNEGYYYFNKPITKLDTITISVGNPNDLVNIGKYEYFKVAMLFDNSLPVIGVPGGIMITLTFPEIIYWTGLLGGTFIGSLFIDDFTTSNPIADKPLIDWVNGREFTRCRMLGTFLPTKVIVEINGNLPAGFGTSFNVYPAGVVLPVGTPSTCRVRINSARVIMNFELEYISDV